MALAKVVILPQTLMSASLSKRSIMAACDLWKYHCFAYTLFYKNNFIRTMRLKNSKKYEQSKNNPEPGSAEF